jgi:hypothetical protein
MALISARRLRRGDAAKALAPAPALSSAVGALIAIATIMFPALAFAATTLQQNTASTPGSGVAGISFVNITASGFPSGPINPANVTIRAAPTCPVGSMGPVAGEADATATSVTTILGSSGRVHFQVPSTLLSGTPIPQGTYLAQIVDATDGFAGGNCSLVVTANTSPALTCVPSSSMAVVAGHAVTAYVPKSCWTGPFSACTATTGVGAVEIEPILGGSSTPIATASPVNACAGNPATGQVVCTANNTSVYLITGTTLTNTLTSGLTGTASFSGGQCTNCGVAINALTNTAAIAGSLLGSSSGNGVQILNLNTNMFQIPFGLQQTISENISIDAGRNLILSPSEGEFGPRNYVLLSTNSATGAVTGEFDRAITTGGDPDSAAEDCSTGIALSSVEFTSNVYLADLSQSTLTPGSPAGSWTSPSTLFTFTGQSLGFSFAGTAGITVAPGVVTPRHRHRGVWRKHLWHHAAAADIGHPRRRSNLFGLGGRGDAKYTRWKSLYARVRSPYRDRLYQPQHRQGHGPLLGLAAPRPYAEVYRGDRHGSGARRTARGGAEHASDRRERQFDHERHRELRRRALTAPSRGLGRRERYLSLVFLKRIWRSQGAGSGEPGRGGGRAAALLVQ